VGFDKAKAQVRLNLGFSKTHDIVVSDMLKAVELGIARPYEFRKGAIKFGWELGEAS